MDRGPDALARVLDMAIQSKNAAEETSAGAFGYEQGSPQKVSSPKYNSRFAGESLIGGINGEFGRITNDRNNKPAQDALATWAGQWASGPFSLGIPGGPPPEGDQPPMNA
tara:strand:+ start:1495 stop:1824 length:330 start_codon:yes stop_codon:yes gene_type:complete